MEANQNIMVWWTNQDHCCFEPREANYTKLPDYLWEQYRSRYGRPARGALKTAVAFVVLGALLALLLG